MRRRSLLLALAAPDIARAEASWPARPIRIVNPFPAGSPDAMARFMAERLSPALGQPVLVESRSGAGGTIGAGVVAGAPPDGHTLGISNVTTHAVAPATHSGLRYDGVRDFTHLALLGELPLAIAVRADGPIADVTALVAEARRAPGSIRVGTVGSGGPSHILLALLAREQGAEVTTVPFRGGTAAALEVMGGRIEAAMASLGELGNQDRLRVLALASEARHPRFPAVPTLRETGFDQVANAWFGLCAPAGLPPAIAARLSAEVRAIARTDAYAGFLAGLNAMPWRELDGEGMTRFVAAEAVRWGEAARATGVRAE